MNQNQLIRAIFAVETLDDLKGINQAARQRWSELESRGILRFRKGMSVKFRSRNGGTIVGLVCRVNRKSVTVRVNGHMTYRVSPSLLSPLHKSETA